MSMRNAERSTSFRSILQPSSVFRRRGGLRCRSSSTRCSTLAPRRRSTFLGDDRRVAPASPAPVESLLCWRKRSASSGIPTVDNRPAGAVVDEGELPRRRPSIRRRSVPQSASRSSDRHSLWHSRILAGRTVADREDSTCESVMPGWDTSTCRSSRRRSGTRLRSVRPQRAWAQHPAAKVAEHSRRKPQHPTASVQSTVGEAAAPYSVSSEHRRRKPSRFGHSVGSL
jgi:hypothetical protein